MNRRLNIGMDCVKSLERDDGGVRPGATFQGERRSVSGGGDPGRVRGGVPCWDASSVEKNFGKARGGDLGRQNGERQKSSKCREAGSMELSHE